jgi:ABC-2 type transport system ATP-binding protein
MPSPVRVSGVSKRYRLRSRSLKDLVIGLAPRRSRKVTLPRTLWALTDVSFEVERGTTFAVIGANGSGKSTLLKLLAGMMPPTRGSLAVHGRLAMLSVLGGLFHGDLTGRENVFLEGALLGLSRRELRARLEAILAFAEVEAFADVPVKFYSSGMSLRLAFAIAAHTSPEVLLVDEAFAVGDTAFRDRCLGQMLRFKAAGATIVLVSHERYLVEQLADTVLLLEHGRPVALGRPADAFAAYEGLLEEEEDEGPGASAIEGSVAAAPLVIEAVELHGGRAGDDFVYHPDDVLRLRIRARATQDVSGAALGVQVAREWHVLHGTRSNRQGIEIDARVGQVVTLEVEYRPLGLAQGAYAVHVSVFAHRLAVAPVLVLKRAARFRVTHPESEGVGLVRLAHQWRQVTEPPPG